jgi:hypothetical protein
MSRVKIGTLNNANEPEAKLVDVHVIDSRLYLKAASIYNRNH